MVDQALLLVTGEEVHWGQVAFGQAAAIKPPLLGEDGGWWLVISWKSTRGLSLPGTAPGDTATGILVACMAALAGEAPAWLAGLVLVRCTLAAVPWAGRRSLGGDTLRPYSECQHKGSGEKVLVWFFFPYLKQLV